MPTQEPLKKRWKAEDKRKSEQSEEIYMKNQKETF